MTNYADAGVDINRGEEAVKRLKTHVEGTYTENVLKGVGAFAGAFNAKALKEQEEPVLLASVDGVGTKTIIAAAMNSWEGIGHDIVNHSSNDLVCQGASPLLFLDYVASSHLDPEVIESIVKGMSDACKNVGCVLIGGETAEMPKVYQEGEHDVVGAIIGSADRKHMITGETIVEGDVLIALPSNGLHTNGYSLARKVLLEDAGMDIAEVGEALLKPHTPYSPLILKLHKEVGLKGVAHITGGGIPGNLPRILPDGLGAKVEKSSIQVLPIFELIQEKGGISDEAMYEAFNMGVGMIVVVGAGDVDAILNEAEGSYVIGEITPGEVALV